MPTPRPTAADAVLLYLLGITLAAIVGLILGTVARLTL